jgi:hypothetical protein
LKRKCRKNSKRPEQKGIDFHFDFISPFSALAYCKFDLFLTRSMVAQGLTQLGRHQAGVAGASAQVLKAGQQVIAAANRVANRVRYGYSAG